MKLGELVVSSSFSGRGKDVSCLACTTNRGPSIIHRPWDKDQARTLVQTLNKTSAGVGVGVRKGADCPVRVSHRPRECALEA
jgi:hypothetical protein